jgi:hypothetical protein
MIRILSRIVAVAVILSLNLLTASPAQATPLGGAHWISKMPARWIDDTLSWLSNLLPESTQPQTQGATAKNDPVPPPVDPDDPGYTADTGSCIDPLGNPCVIDPEP